MTPKSTLSGPPAPPVRFCLGVTGHREGNTAFAANRTQIELVLADILDQIAATVAAEAAASPSTVFAPTRLHSLLSEGADQIAAETALTRGWDLVAPLPFGLNLNVAINALPATPEDARAMLAGLDPPSVNVAARARQIHAIASRAQLFELADRDEMIGRLLVASLQYPDDPKATSTFAAESSIRAAFAAKVMIEQSDLIIAIWDGATRAFIGGTGHTIQVALETGAPVVWIDAKAPDRWRILYGPESLAGVNRTADVDARRLAELRSLVRSSLKPPGPRRTAASHGTKAHHSHDPLNDEKWRAHSNFFWHGYRRVEALFGGTSFKARFKNLRQTYETPDAIASGSASEFLSSARRLPRLDAAFTAAIETSILRRFAWSDGVSSGLSDTYRGGMVLNFLLASLAVVGGLAYLPFATSKEKWMFAALELALLVAILTITIVGQQRRWHGRWFETRRVAEYLRHAPILLLLGVARAPGRWPKGAETSWPEWYARRGLREVGLPSVVVTQAYLRLALGELLNVHVVRQREYHEYKANRLAAAHRNLDKLSEVLFTAAVFSVAIYLVLKGGGELHLWSKKIASGLSYVFTFLGVALPTFGGTIAGIRYFGDFERFAAISEVTAERLGAVQSRIAVLRASDDTLLDYGHVADLAHATDDITVGEIESWQAVFGGKHVTVPV